MSAILLMTMDLLNFPKYFTGQQCGGVVNLGWADNSPGDDCLIDGVYVVKTDWHTPVTPSWTTTVLNGSNNAIVASLMVPGANFENIFTPASIIQHEPELHQRDANAAEWHGDPAYQRKRRVYRKHRDKRQQHRHSVRLGAEGYVASAGLEWRRDQWRELRSWRSARSGKHCLGVR